MKKKLLFCLILFVSIFLLSGCEQGTYSVTAEGKPILDIEIYDAVSEENVRWHSYQGGEVLIGVFARNTDETNSVTKYLECGIYDKSLVGGWYSNILSVIGSWEKNVPNCIVGEQNVQTKKLTWSAGESHNIVFEVIAPMNLKYDYVIHCGDYYYCFKDNPDTGQTSHDIHSFTIIDKPDIPNFPDATCFDASINQDETDINCGGKICDPCPDGYKCNVDSDCYSNNCDLGRCRVEPEVFECYNDGDCRSKARVECVSGSYWYHSYYCMENGVCAISTDSPPSWCTEKPSPPDGPVCGDGICQSTESNHIEEEGYCPADCGNGDSDLLTGILVVGGIIIFIIIVIIIVLVLSGKKK